MPITDWAPNVRDVGAWVRARTKDIYGNELGTFNENTRPTGDEVAILINDTLDDLSTVIGVDVAEAFLSRARAVAALGSALSVELTYFPEQVAQGRSPYRELKELYDQRLGRLLTALTASGAETNAPGGSMSPYANAGKGLANQEPSVFDNPFVGPIPAVDWADRW